jgi:hypothetical protein
MEGILPHFFIFICSFITRSVAFHSLFKTELTLVVYLSVSVLEKPLFNRDLLNEVIPL